MTEQTESTVSGKTVLHYPYKYTRTLPNITVDTYTIISKHKKNQLISIGFSTWILKHFKQNITSIVKN